MRPFPSDSTTEMVPVSATPKLAPRHGHLGPQEPLAQVQPRRLGELAGLVAEVGPLERDAEEIADLGAVLVDRGHHDVGRRLAGELHDQLGEVGLGRRARRRGRAPR